MEQNYNRIWQRIIATNNVERAKEVIKNGAPVNFENHSSIGTNFDGIAPIMRATKENKELLALELVKAGANLSLRDSALHGEFTPLMHAVSNNMYALVCVMVSQVDKKLLNQQSSFGETALDIAERKEYSAIIKVLIKNKAKRENKKFEGFLNDCTDALLKNFNKAIELNPKSAAAYYNRGLAKAKLGDNAGAIKDYNKAIELDPKDAYCERGSAKICLDDYTGAIKDFNKAIELNPKDAVAYYGRGLAKVGLGDKQGALEDLNIAGEQGYDKAYDLIKKI